MYVCIYTYICIHTYTHIHISHLCVAGAKENLLGVREQRRPGGCRNRLITHCLIAF